MKKNMIKNSFLKAIATLMSSSIIVQIIAVVISLIMTRLYTENQIGEYTLLLTAVTMFSPVICGRYEMAIVGEDEEDNVFPLMLLSVIVALVLSVAVGLFYTIYLELTNRIEINSLLLPIWLILVLLLIAFCNILTAYNNRKRNYKLIATTAIAQEIGKGGALISLGTLKIGTMGLLISHFFGAGIGLGVQTKSLRGKIQKKANFSKDKLKYVAKKHYKQLFFSAPAIFANSFSYSILNIFIDYLFGVGALGYYSMSFRMLGVPLTLISTNISKAYFEKASKKYSEEGDFCEFFLHTSFLLLMFSVPITFMLIEFSPWAFELFFGEGWSRSGEYVRILAPMFGIRLIVSALTPTLIICRKQNIELLLQSFFMVFAILFFVLFQNSLTMETFLIGISIGFSIIYIFYYVIMLKFSLKKKEVKTRDD